MFFVHKIDLLLKLVYYFSIYISRVINFSSYTYTI